MSLQTVKSSRIRRIAFARTLVAICVAIGTTVAAHAETFVEGLSAYNSGDYASAYGIWLPLAARGDANSQSSLAYLFREGKGVHQDSKAAAKWYYLAASRGEPTAQSFLCQMHLRGDGVPRDLVLALMWCELSIDGGERWASVTRDRVMSKMSTAERDRAWELVTRWRTEHPDATAAAAAATGSHATPLGGVDEARAH